MPGLLNTPTSTAAQVESQSTPHLKQNKKPSSSDWSFTFRRGFESGSDSDSDVCDEAATNAQLKTSINSKVDFQQKKVKSEKKEEDCHQCSVETEDARLLRELDIASRADRDTVQYKANPWSIARINAASRSTLGTSENTISDCVTSSISSLASTLEQRPVSSGVCAQQSKTNLTHRQTQTGEKKWAGDTSKKPLHVQETIKGFFRTSKSGNNVDNGTRKCTLGIQYAGTEKNSDPQQTDLSDASQDRPSTQQNCFPPDKQCSINLTRVPSDLDIPTCRNSDSGPSRLYKTSLKKVPSSSLHVLAKDRYISENIESNIKNQDPGDPKNIYGSSVATSIENHARSLHESPRVRQNTYLHNNVVVSDTKQVGKINVNSFGLNAGMSTPCHSQSEMLFHRGISEPPTCPLMERTLTNMKIKPHFMEKDDDINYYYDAIPPDLVDSKFCSFSSPIRPSYPGIVSNTMTPGSIPTRIREDKGHIETDRQIRNGGVVLAASPRSATGRKGNRYTCIDISRVQHIQGAPQISSRDHHGGLYTTKKGIEPTLTQCASTPQRSGRNKGDNNPTIDAYSVVLGDKDATWSTLPMRKKTRKEESKAFSSIRQSKKFMLPIKLPFSSSPLRDLNYVSNEQGNISNTSSRRVVTYIPPPRGTDVSDTSEFPNSRKENDVVLRPASEWSIKRFTFNPKISSDSAMRTNGTNKLDSTSPSKRLRVVSEVPINYSLLTTAGDNQRRQLTSNEAQEQTHRTDNSPNKESDVSTLLSDESSDTNSFITAYKPTTFSGTTSPDSAKETIRSEDNDDTDMSVYLDISTLERTYPQTRAMILESKNMRSKLWDELGLPSCGVVYSDADVNPEPSILRENMNKVDVNLSDGDVLSSTRDKKDNSRCEIGIVIWG